MSATNRGKKRHERDMYETPSWCVEVLIPEIVWGFEPDILEPAAGNGAIVEVLQRDVYPNIYRGDITTGQDFLDDQSTGRYDFIVTNPPYSLAQSFVDKALHIANCVIMLPPFGLYGSLERHDWWIQHEPTAQFTLSRRPMFAKNKDGKWGTDSETYAWLVWDATGRQKRGFYHLCPTEEQYRRSVTEHKARYEARERELVSV